MKDIKVIKNYSDKNTGEIHLEGEEFKVPIARAEELVGEGVVIELTVEVEGEKKLIDVSAKKEKVEIGEFKEKKEIDK